LRTGCKNCVNTADLITKKAAEPGIEARVEKVTDMADITGYGIMSTPSIVIDEKLVHADGMPTPDAVVKWLQG